MEEVEQVVIGGGNVDEVVKEEVEEVEEEAKEEDVE